MKRATIRILTPGLAWNRLNVTDALHGNDDDRQRNEASRRNSPAKSSPPSEESRVESIPEIEPEGLKIRFITEYETDMFSPNYSNVKMRRWDVFDPSEGPHMRSGAPDFNPDAHFWREMEAGRLPA